MRHPITVIGAMAAAFFVIVPFVIPTSSKPFARVSYDLPLPTRVMVGISIIRQDHGHISPITVVVLVTAFVC